jgi:SAM-dependent methyltransferase
MKRWIPWWAKILLKIVWSRLPVPYGVWKRIGVFRHGFMERPDYVSTVFLTHWNRSDFRRKTGEFHAMELGCGDSLASCLMGRAVGAAGYCLVDAGEFADGDVDTYKRIATALAEAGQPIPDISRCRSVAEMLTSVHARYLTNGLESLRSLPDNSIDFIWSQAVFEHIRHAEFAPTLRELRRILRDDGVMSHRVDLRDHLSEALNNLRPSAKLWESRLMASSGFYTNRIRYGAMLKLMESAGFIADVVNVDRWKTLPTPRNKLAPEFRSLPDDDLLVRGFDVVLRPTRPAADPRSLGPIR